MNMQIKKILEDRDIKNIYHSALKVLSQVGMKCDHKKAIDVISQKSIIKYENGRILFYEDVLEEFFKNRDKKLDSDNIDNKFRMGGQWHCWELCDPITNTPRPATMEESVQMAKLSEALGSKGLPIPVAPGSVGPRLHTLLSEKIALIHTRTLGGMLTATDREEIKMISEMHKAAGRKYVLGLEGLISPLKFNSEIFNTYFDWCDDPDLEIGIMASIPMAGATAPLVFPANLVLSLAEALALDYVVQTLSDRKLEQFSIRLEPFDMKCSNIVYGSPEWCLFRQAVIELWEGIIGRRPKGAFRTNGRVVDGQTMLERTASFMWQALLGIRNFGAVGQLCVDEVYSPVQAILDREILRYGQRLFDGIKEECWDRNRDIVEIIKEGVAEGGFLTHDTTLDVFRDMYDFGRLSSSINLGAWRSEGSVTLEAKAWEEAQALIKGHDFELDEVRRKDVEKIYEKGVRYLSEK